MDIKSMAQAMLANYVDATNSVIATQSCSKYPNHHKIGQALETGLTATFAAQRIIDTKGDMNSNSFLKAFMTLVMYKFSNALIANRQTSLHCNGSLN